MTLGLSIVVRTDLPTYLPGRLLYEKPIGKFPGYLKHNLIPDVTRLNEIYSSSQVIFMKLSGRLTSGSNNFLIYSELLKMGGKYLRFFVDGDGTCSQYIFEKQKI